MLSRFSAEAFALLRIVSGTLFAMHGTEKLFGFPGGSATGETLLIAAGVIEAGCGVLIAIGFQVGWAGLAAAGEAAAVYLLRHAPQAPWPIVNRGELALVYCFLFLFIAAHGSGKWSADEEGAAQS